MQSRADFIGFIFTVRSKRVVQAPEVSCWLKELGDGAGKKLVGVFADDSIEKISDVLGHVALDVIQLHGHESPQEAADIRRTTGVSVWKAIHHGPDTVEMMHSYGGMVDGFVIDTKVKGMMGGTGKTFDWNSVPAYEAEAKEQHVPCLIAGGVKPENIQHLLAFQPSGIDISSGIESHFRKDCHLMRKIEEKVWINDAQTASD
ncbi:phosphoribosylanthranilate isomerase [Sporolactobacillus sp. THM19-2]|uniref:phosphoribosylanthranilate isomerase n=1 Tax=Sporolactobacillus sp. THM19-2 TaxID=2511171 RepID=UPI002DB860D4|nr:phosphoribosylanthranilate isomerase [Sporolactobacillus sp. THM19-2]